MDKKSKRIGDALVVKNSERKFGSNNEYFFLRIELEDGIEKNLLFTENELKIAEERANKNIEDLPKLSWIRDLLD